MVQPLHLTVIMKDFSVLLYPPRRTRVVCGTTVPDVNSLRALVGCLGASW